MNGYWVSYEVTGGGIASWSDYAYTADEFIDNLLGKEDNIKKFIELVMDEEDGVSIRPNQKISIAKYNRKLKR